MKRIETQRGPTEQSRAGGCGRAGGPGERGLRTDRPGARVAADGAGGRMRLDAFGGAHGKNLVITNIYVLLVGP